MAGISARASRQTRATPGWWITAVLFCCWVVALLDRLILILLVPSIKQSLHVSDTQVSLLIGAAFAIFYAAAGLPFGRLADRVNRRNLLAFGLIGWSLATVACGLSHSFLQLFIARIFVGVCQAVLAPASLSMVGDYCPPERRGRITGLLISGSAIGGAGSSIMGGVVLDLFAGHKPISIPLVGALAPWQATLVVAGLLGFVLAPLLFTINEPVRRRDGEALRIDVIKYLSEHWGTFAPLYVAFTFMLMVSYGLSAWYPIIFLRNLHIPPHKAGLTLGLINIGAAVVAATVVGSFSDALTRRDPAGGRLLAVRILLVAYALILLPLLYLGSSLELWTADAMFATVATSATAVAYTILPELAPNEARGQVIAVFQFLGYIFGLGLAPTLIALVTDKVLHNEAQVNLSMLIIALPSLVIAVALATLAAPRARRLREHTLVTS